MLLKKMCITALVFASISALDCRGVCPTLNNASHLQQGEIIDLEGNKWVVADIDLPKPKTQQLRTHLDVEQKWGNDRLVYCQYMVEPRLSLKAARVHGVIKLFKVPEGRSVSHGDAMDVVPADSSPRGDAMDISK